MSTANPPQTSAAPASTRASSATNAASGHLHNDAGLLNGHHHHHHHDAGSISTHSSTTASKKAKAKKATDPNEASKLIAAKISQLELDAAGEKDQEAEIGACEFQLLFHK